MQEVARSQIPLFAKRDSQRSMGKLISLAFTTVSSFWSDGVGSWAISLMTISGSWKTDEFSAEDWEMLESCDPENEDLELVPGVLSMHNSSANLHRSWMRLLDERFVGDEPLGHMEVPGIRVCLLAGCRSKINS